MSERLIDSYNISPIDIKDGDIALMIVKVMIGIGLNREGESTSCFRLYRCRATDNHFGKPAPIPSALVGIPQGARIYGTDEELIAIVRALFPSILNAGIVPDQLR